VRPLNPRERGEGHRSCVLLDDETRQVVLTVRSSRWSEHLLVASASLSDRIELQAVDKSTLIQLKGSSAKVRYDLLDRS